MLRHDRIRQLSRLSTRNRFLCPDLRLAVHAPNTAQGAIGSDLVGYDGTGFRTPSDGDGVTLHDTDALEGAAGLP